MRAPRIHWAGGLEYTTLRGAWVGMGAGYPCCCSGDRATKIRTEGAQTWDRERVDCKACLRLLARPSAKAGDWRARFGLEP